MPFLRTRITVHNRFPEVNREVNSLARNAVLAGAAVGAASARAAASDRVDTGRMGAIHIEGPEGTADGWVAAFVSPSLAAWYQNFGTLGNRKKPLKRSPRTDRDRSPGTGVEPSHFLDIGRRDGARAMRQMISRGL
jgi:hypothetical protein